MKKLRRIYKRFISPIIQLHPKNISRFFGYLKDVKSYRALGGRIDILWPVVGENTNASAIDPHYFYQGVWTARHVAQQKPPSHVDVGSQTDLVGFLTSITNVQSVDIRPLKIALEHFESVPGSILHMPMPDATVPSLSCLHVAEHIGLGRYGDPLDPLGTEKACRELSRILAPQGRLYFSLPIGEERTEYNAHRIHLPSTIIHYFSELKLIEFSAINDRGEFIKNADLKGFDGARYACGLFLFTKEAKSE